MCKLPTIAYVASTPVSSSTFLLFCPPVSYSLIASKQDSFVSCASLHVHMWQTLGRVLPGSYLTHGYKSTLHKIQYRTLLPGGKKKLLKQANSRSRFSGPIRKDELGQLCIYVGTRLWSCTGRYQSHTKFGCNASVHVK